MRESAIQKAIITWLREQGCYAVNIHGHPMQEAGVPDILSCWRGRFLAIEVKCSGETTTPIQAYHLEQIRKAGGVTLVAHSLEEVRRELELGFP